MAPQNYFSDLPFSRLSDYQIMWECCTTKNKFFQKYDSSKLRQLLKNQVPEYLHDMHIIDSKYYELEQFNSEFGNKGNHISYYATNIRKLGLHRGELMAFMSCLKLKFNVIILTEIGIDACHYVSSVFDGYECFYNLPDDNSYGGVAIYVKTTLNGTI